MSATERLPVVLLDDAGGGPGQPLAMPPTGATKLLRFVDDEG